MKKPIALFLAALLSLSILAACDSSEKTGAAGGEVTVAEGYDYSRLQDRNITLNVYNWGEYISTGTDGESMAVNAEFEKLTGIKIKYTNFDTNESLYAKLKSGGANYDVIFPSDYMIGRMILENMLEPLDFSNIPNYKMIGENYKNQPYDIENKYSVPYTWGYVGLIYNKKLVPETPDSWDVLWDSTLSGQILMFDNSRDAFAIALRRLGRSMNPKSVDDIDFAQRQLSEQKPLVQAYVMDQIFQKMTNGEAAAAPYYAGDAITMMADNPDLGFIVPKEGVNAFIDAVCIPAGSKNKEAAEMYINFLCESEVSAANSEAIGYSTPQTEAQSLINPALRANPIAYPPDSFWENTETFNVLPDALNAAMDKAWSDMRGGTSGNMPWLVPLLIVVAIAVIVAGAILQRRRKKKKVW